MEEKTIKQLNKEQKGAVEHTEGPLLVIAGAGTGKTTVLIERLKYLVSKKLARPDEILLVTFTEKAASEMEDRALKALPYGCLDLWISTFHSFCERILRDHALDIGLSTNFKLLNETEQWILIRKNLDRFDLDYYRPLGNPTKFIHELIKHFSRLKDENISACEYLEWAEEENRTELVEVEAEEIEMAKFRELANAYHLYNQLLLENDSLDFGDLINYTIKLFKERPNILNYYRNKFKYIMIDEFQDTNWAQYELIKILAAPKNNLMVVGDDDQAIYRFRGASLSNIMQFKDDYPEAREIVLVKNYRSVQAIIDAAYGFIKHNNPNRLEVKLNINKKLKSVIPESGKVNYEHFVTIDDEVSTVIQKIIKIHKNNEEVNWSDFAILVRANETADIFVSECVRAGVPHRFVSLRGLYNKPIILDILAYFKLLDNYHESSALFRVLNMDAFKILYKDIININRFARRKVWSMYEALQNINVIPDISAESVNKVHKLLALITKHSNQVNHSSPSRILLNFVKDANLLIGLDHDRDREIFSYLNQFYEKIKKLESANPDLRLKDFMEIIEMEMEAGDVGALRDEFEDADVVKIMTVHMAKGLEFKYVFIPCLVDKKFPVVNRKEKISIPDALIKEKLAEGDLHIEEERRLFYVALTRAQKELFLSSASDYGGVREKKPSIFLEELRDKKEEYYTRIKKSKKENILTTFEKDLLGTEEELKVIKKYSLPKQFSFSQLEAYSNCPLQYKFAFILRIPVEDKVSFIFGKIMHNTLRDFFSYQLVSAQQSLFGEVDAVSKPSLEELLEIYQKNWRDDGYYNKKQREDYKNKGKKILKEFYQKLEKEGWPQVIFLEKSFKTKIGDYIFKGSIDRIDRLPDGTVKIIDYKTGQAKEKIDASHKRQLLLYKIAAESSLGLKVSELANYYLDNNTELSFFPKDREVEKLEERILAEIEEIKKCNFAPKPGHLCKYCDFKGICEFRK